uniref:Putative ATPase n=1 Tax=Brachypodium sylvaticum TaxID=29664 RepID=Q2L3E8_BRASY|nr:putative ATPase [Brachypodium sylvaticum]
MNRNGRGYSCSGHTKLGIAVAGETLKIAKPLLARNAEVVAALPANMKLIKDELEIINAFLKEIGLKGCKGEVIETWIRQVRRLAYDMEDVVDQFMYVVAEKEVTGSWAYLKKIFKKPQCSISLDDIATKADIVNKELIELSKRRSRWTQPIVGLNDIPTTSYDNEQLLYLPGHDRSINDDELIGIYENKETLIEMLHFKDRSMRIIAVWGMGGIGKSTLVNNVYTNELSHFSCRAWVSISQSYKLEDIWRNMLRELVKDNREFDAEKMYSAELRTELKKILKEKRYLIILDDVWRAGDFFKISEVLVDNGLGSRVIITTRIEDVASVAADGCKIKVEPLKDHDAWFLFCRKAFPNIENHTCPPELCECGKAIVGKCDGLPLALVAIGSLLSLNTKSNKKWRVFYDQLISELHNNENLNRVEKILNLSYKHLPNYLKNCFLHCAMFPEDYLLHRKRLIRLWIAEGFVEQRGASNLEDVAEGYLIELVERSMLHVVNRNSFDRIRCLRMHDLVRDLAISQCKKESFCTVYDDTDGVVVQLGLDPRRVAVLHCNNDIRSSIDPTRLRTFISFDTSMLSSSWSSFIPSESKYLAVLDLSGLPIETIPNSFGELFNLRYVCLDDTNVKLLPKSMKKLHNLQTLSLKRTELLNIPQEFSNLKKLRHLLIWKLVDATYTSLNNWESVEPFDGLWKLKELQSLSEIRATKDFVAELGNLSQLRTLCITYVRSSYCAQLCDSLSKLHHLSTLHIRAYNEDELLLLEDLTMPKPLEKLGLIGRLSEGTFKSPFFSTHGNRLLNMELSWCQFTENPVARLFELSNLTELHLTRAYTGHQLNFHAKWFEHLKKLALSDLPRVNQICIHEGALVSLEYLHIYSLKELRDVPTGIKFLNSIKEAYFTRMHPDFVLQMEKLNHIPRVHWSTQGKFKLSDNAHTFQFMSRVFQA